ncbi:hypothetical protein FoTM2_013379 [Fusarium oxysporum f. sp. vasinfectum]|nr:hypothetical protein FoTM2_013379 [Fusarium oxysporum f. sp. vasinfectum]
MVYNPGGGSWTGHGCDINTFAATDSRTNPGATLTAVTVTITTSRIRNYTIAPPSRNDSSSSPTRQLTV